MRLQTRDFDYNVDWNKDDDDYEDVLESVRDFRVFDPIAEEVEIRNFIKKDSRVLLEDILD